jgi:argininosuccinate lyase
VGYLYRSRLTDKALEKISNFISSIKEDERIFEEDIDGTEAHDIMLYEQGLITRQELGKILSSLEKLRLEKRKGSVKLDSKYEDIHEFIENYVITDVGLEVGGKLHTGRSRNDQVVLDVRMNLRSDLLDIFGLLIAFIETLLKRGEEHKESPMMFYTHTQQAQIGSLSHYFIAYADGRLRDFKRLRDCYDRVNLSPLGAGPIGGTSITINRKRTASLLGFNGVLENSIDAVSSRDFILEAVSALAVLMSGLSRLTEDLILWSSAEFRYIEIDDKYASVSSIMPHKKNPNVLELIRGKTGKVYGNLISVLSIIKGLPTGYSSDLQETKPPLWDSIDLVKNSLEVLIDLIDTFKVNTERMAEIISDSYAFAVDLAEILSQNVDLSFREAHMVVGNIVREMISLGKKPSDLQAETIEKVAEKILGKKINVDNSLIRDVTDVKRILSKRQTIGGPSSKEVERMLQNRKELLRECNKELYVRKKYLDQAKIRLAETVKKYSSSRSTR